MKQSKSLFFKVVSVLLTLTLVLATVLMMPMSASAATTYYLRGTFNGWEAEDAYILKDNGNGTYSITISLPAGTHQYKIAVQDWSWSVPAQDATLRLAEDAMVEFKMNPATYTQTAGIKSAPTADVYLRGSFDGEMWPAKAENKLTSTGNNNFKLLKTLPAGSHEYKIAVSDWSWAIPTGANAKLNLTTESQVLFEANTLTGAFNATVLKGDTRNFYKFDDVQENLTIRSAWDDHSDQVLCERDGKLAYISTSNADYANANTSWNFLPMVVDGGPDGPVELCIIQNADTEKCLYIADNGEVCTKDVADYECWWYVDNSTGKYRILNMHKEFAAINTEKQNGYVQANEIPAYYLSSQFEIDLDYVYGYSYTLSPDGIVDTKGTVTVNSPTSLTSTTSGTAKTWTQVEDTSGSPIFEAPNTPLAEAVYNLSMEETIINQFESEFGTALLTGETWYKVWTRDTAMSCEFSLAAIYPDLSLNCAKEKVVSYDRTFSVFEEDTGTGGSYPVSTDKIITYLSVWEIYLATGDESVLEYFYDICMNTIEQDYNTAYDAEFGLIKGETCGLDWRSQTYPDWMGNEVEESLANIAECKAASVNLIYLGVLDRMIKTSEILGKGDETQLQAKYDALYKAVTTRLWHDELGCYAAWEYPAYMGAPLAYKIDSIANGYALWFGIGSQEQLNSIAENYPLVTYGANVVYPNKQGDLEHKDRVYHNRGVWPGWEAQLMLAGAQHGYDELSEEIWNSCITAAATSLVNKEVVDFTTGEGIHVNHQLWSIAATLSGYYKVLFGMIYDQNGITFEPYVPEWMEGPFYLSNYKYCDATLDLTLTGKGSNVVSITVNGEDVGTSYTLPFGAKGNYKIEIVVSENENEYNDETVNLNDQKNHVISPKMPVATLSGTTLKWGAQAGCTYKVWTGAKYVDVDTNSYTIDPSVYGAYSVVVISKDGVWSEMSRPVIVSPDRIKIEAENCTFTGDIFKETKNGKGHLTDVYTNNQKGGTITINVNVAEAGMYAFWACYNDCSANDPTSCSNAAIRSVFVDGKDIGALVFPVVNFDYQTSTHLILDLEKGAHEIVVKFDKNNFYDFNMSQDIHIYGNETYNPDNTVQFDYFVLDKADSLFEVQDEEKILNGDANCDEDVSIMDATTIQLAIAMKNPEPYSDKASDVDADGEATIMDVTYIQRYLAQYDDGLSIGSYK